MTDKHQLDLDDRDPDWTAFLEDVGEDPERWLEQRQERPQRAVSDVRRLMERNQERLKDDRGGRRDGA